MKFIIIGLGQFGTSLGEKLTSMGHEVIGVDKSMDRVEQLKEKFTHTICLNTKEPDAVNSLPLKNTDTVVVCIGEDEGDNIMTTALLKRLNVKRLVSRSVSQLHENVLEAMGVTEIVRPEIETAERWSIKLTSSGFINLYEITKEHHLVEIKVPKKFIGHTIEQIGFNKNYNVIVLTKLRQVNETNLIGVSTTVMKAGEVVTAKTTLNENDILVVYGHKNDIKRMMDYGEKE
jgi:trk system potassium uptake protein TrkA